jgi:hypothetical protein
MERLEERAHPVVNAMIDAAGLLTVTATGSDAVEVAASGGRVLINGADPTSGAAAAASIRALAVWGGTGANRIDLSGLNATGFPILTRVRVDGGLGFDTLVGPASGAIWTLGGADVGTLSGVGVGSSGFRFAEVETLVGGAGDDVFAFAAGATLSGSIDGGAGDDALDFSDYQVGVGVRLIGSDTAGFRGSAGMLGLGFAGIDRLVGSGWDDTLLGRDGDATWGLDDAFTYDDGSHRLVFTGFETLRGGAGADVFEPRGGALGVVTAILLGGDGEDRLACHAGGYLIGVFDGQGGMDTIDASALGEPVVARVTWALPGGDWGQLEQAIGPVGFRGVDRIRGGSGGGQDVMIGSDAGATWDLGAGIGRYVAAGGGVLEFTGFEGVRGGLGADHYRVTAAAGSRWVVSDDGGVDTLDFSGSAEGVRIDLDAAGAQGIAAGAWFRLEGRFENFVGSAYSDEVRAEALLVGRRLDGGEPAVAPGDVLRVPAGSVVGPGTIVRTGSAPINHSGWERIDVEGTATGVADLRLAILAPQRVVPGQAVAFRVVVLNRGPDVATGVSVLATARGVDATGGGPEFWVELGMLGVGESATATFTVTPRRPGRVVLDAIAGSDQAEPTADDNHGSREVEVVEGEATGPRVVDVRRLRMVRGRTRVLVRFRGELDAESAVDRRSYRLAIAGPDGRLGTPDDSAVRIRAVRYRGPGEGVVLVTWRRFRLSRPLLVVIGADGGPRDAEGRGLIGAPRRWVVRDRRGVASWQRLGAGAD